MSYLSVHLWHKRKTIYLNITQPIHKLKNKKMNTLEQAEAKQKEIINICHEYNSFAGVAVPISVINDLVGHYIEECTEVTPNYLKEVVIQTFKLVSFMTTLHENLNDLTRLHDSLKTQVITH